MVVSSIGKMIRISFCWVIESSSLYSPFELVYGMKARLPLELDLPMHTYQGDEGIMRWKRWCKT